MLANVPSLFLLPLDLLDSREDDCKDEAVESCSAFLPDARRLHQVANTLRSGLLWVETCPLGGNVPFG